MLKNHQEFDVSKAEIKNDNEESYADEVFNAFAKDRQSSDNMDSIIHW